MSGSFADSHTQNLPPIRADRDTIRISFITAEYMVACMDPADARELPAEPRETVHSTAQRSYSFEQLAGEFKEIYIEHAGAQYRLRLTRNDKLILTK